MLHRVLPRAASVALLACGFFTSSLALRAAGAGPIVLVLGPPGSGKTVNAQKISKRYKIPSISVADLLKQSGGWGKVGSTKIARAPVESGDMVSDEIAIRLLEQRLSKSDANKGFVLDGFPITVKQAEFLETVSSQRGLGRPVVLHLTVTDGTATDRMLKRGRSDDNPATIERRLAEYRMQADLVLKRYPQVVAIDAGGTPDEVWKKVEQGLKTMLPNLAR